jgi:hypothetical protein
MSIDQSSVAQNTQKAKCPTHQRYVRQKEANPQVLVEIEREKELFREREREKEKKDDVVKVSPLIQIDTEFLSQQREQIKIRVKDDTKPLENVKVAAPKTTQHFNDHLLLKKNQFKNESIKQMG